MKSSPQPANADIVNFTNGKGAHIPGDLLEIGRADAAAALQQFESHLDGLTQAEAGARLKQYGLNVIAREQRLSALIRLLSNVKNPLVLLLIALGILSFLTGDIRATVVIFVMVILSTVLRFVQEMRADKSAEKLKAMVSNTATLVRDGREKEVPLKMLVPGDIIRLAAGDMTPADVRVLSAKDLFLNQAALSGESLPVKKRPKLHLPTLTIRWNSRIFASWAPTWKAVPQRHWLFVPASRLIWDHLLQV